MEEMICPECGSTSTYRSKKFNAWMLMQENVLLQHMAFLLFNYAESTESSIVFFDMILDQMIKQSLAENGQKVWFFLDEFSLLGHLQYLQSALAYGRSNGFRLIAAVQSVQLLEKNYSESEASCISVFWTTSCSFRKRQNAGRRT